MKKLIVSSDTLKPALAKLGHAVTGDSVLPVLNNLYCKVVPGRLELIGSNTELTIFYQVECEAKEAFEFLISYKFISKIVALNKHCPLEIEAGKMVKVSGPNDSYEIKIAEKLKDFPTLPALPNENSIPVDSNLLSCLHTAMATTGKVEANSRFTYVLMELSQGKIIVASTDGSYMVFSKEFPTSYTFGSQELLLSHKIIRALEGVENVSVCFSEKTIGFKGDNITIINTKTDEKFVDYRKVFPEEWPGNLTINRLSLVEALNKCSMVDDQLHATRFDLTTKKEIKLQSDDHMLQVNVSVSATYDGSVKLTTLNSEKFLKLLNQVGMEELTLAIHDPHKAIIITSSEDEGYKGMIMPIASTQN